MQTPMLFLEVWKFMILTPWPLTSIFTQSDLERISDDIEKLHLRSLDQELKAHCKVCTPSWDWTKLSFVLEATGQLQDEEIVKAQSKINNALLSSLQAGYSLFETNLETDQLQHRRYLVASSGDEAKARAAVVGSLEARSETL